MAGLMKFGVTYCNPFWWLFMIPYKLLIKLPLWILCLPWNTVKACYKMWQWTMNTFSSTLARALVGSVAIFTALPGTWTYVFYEAAHWAGYGEEADAIVTVAATVAKAGWEAGKFAFYLATA